MTRRSLLKLLGFSAPLTAAVAAIAKGMGNPFKSNVYPEFDPSKHVMDIDLNKYPKFRSIITTDNDILAATIEGAARRSAFRKAEVFNRQVTTKALQSELLKYGT